MPDQRPSARSSTSALALIAVLVCLVAGLASGRPDTVALATPFALIALAGRRTPRPAVEPDVSIGPAPGTTSSGRIRLQLTRSRGEGPVGRRLTAVTLAGPGTSADALVLRWDEECPLLVDGPESGAATVLSYGVQLVDADLSDPTPFREAPAVRVSILPPVVQLPSGPVSRRLVGLTGAHTSRRPGTGAELRSVTPRRSGDPLRRIDWRATARRSTDQDRLMVRRTFADAEASVQLVVDSGHDVPGSTAAWFDGDHRLPAGGSLHGARKAAASVAASYLAAGDRVGLDDLSGTRRPVRTAGGARHLEQLRARLADTSVVQRRRRRRDPVPPQGAVVMLFSAFLDDEPGRLLRLWHGQGHPVVGVDCLPRLARTETTTAQTHAVRLTLLRRSVELDALRGSGIPVLSAAGEGTPGGDDHAGDGVPTRGDDPAETAHPADLTELADLAVGLRLLARSSRRHSGPGAARAGGRTVP